MKRLTVIIHRVQTTEVTVADDFDVTGDIAAQLRDQLDARALLDSRTVSICATEGADTALSSFSGDPYIVIEGGLIANTPMLPVIDLDLIDTDAPLPGDSDRATESATIARSFGLVDHAARLEAFAHAHRARITLPGL